MRNILLFLITVLLFACSSESENNSESESDKKISDHIYSFETGIIKYESELGELCMIEYFIDYGKTEKIVNISSTFGNTITIIKDGFIYDYVPDLNTASKREYTDFNYIRMNFSKIEDIDRQDIKIEKLDDDYILDKPCKVYKVTDPENVVTTYYLWENILMKEHFAFSTTAIEIIENPNLDTVSFEIPEGVDIIEWEEGQ